MTKKVMTDKTAQVLKIFSCQPDYLSFIPRSHGAGRKPVSPKSTFDLYTCTVCSTCTHTLTHSNKNLKDKEKYQYLFKPPSANPLLSLINLCTKYFPIILSLLCYFSTDRNLIQLLIL